MIKLRWILQAPSRGHSPPFQRPTGSRTALFSAFANHASVHTHPVFFEILDRKADHATSDTLWIEELDVSAFIEFAQLLYWWPIELKSQDHYRLEINQLVEHILTRS